MSLLSVDYDDKMSPMIHTSSNTGMGRTRVGGVGLIDGDRW